MAKVRFVGDEPHDVPELGRAVAPDELVEVPDELHGSRAWPESLWKQSPTKDKE